MLHKNLACHSNKLPTHHQQAAVHQSDVPVMKRPVPMMLAWSTDVPPTDPAAPQHIQSNTTQQDTLPVPVMKRPLPSRLTQPY
jgi:hypothetical protein